MASDQLTSWDVGKNGTAYCVGTRCASEQRVRPVCPSCVIDWEAQAAAALRLLKVDWPEVLWQ